MAGLDELLKARDKKRAQTQAMVRAAIEPVRIKRPEPPRKRSGTVNPGVTAEDFRQAGVSQVVDLPLVVKAVGESAGNALYGVGAGVSNTLRTRLAQTYSNQVKMGEMAELYFPGRGRAAAAQDLANQRELERQIKVSQQNLANRNGAWQEKYDVLPRPVKWTANAVGQTAQMLPAIGAGMMAGPLVGGAVLGAQVLGNSAGQALNEGASFDHAVKYGAAEAVKEMAIERMFGAIPGLGQGAVNFNGVLAGAPRAAQVVGRTALGAMGEGIEEGVAQVATPFLQRATYAPEAANATWPEILDAAGQGMVGGLLLGGAGNMYQARLAGRSERILEEQAARTERLRNQQTPTGSEALRLGGMRAEDGSFVSRPTPEQQAPTGFTGARGEAGQFASRSGEQQVTAPRLQLHIDQRDAQIIRDKSVNAFQYDHPQVQQYFQQQASVLLGDVRNGVRGQRVMQRDEEGNVIGVTGQGRANSEPIERMLNAGMGYGQIERGLKYIIEDNGKENRQSAKLVEMYLDEAMSNGYQSMDGDVGINYEYLDAKSHIAGAVPNALYRDAETLAGVQQEMQSPRVEEQGNITDADASNVEALIRRFIDRSTTKAGLRYRIVDGLDDRINAYIEGDTIIYNVNRLDSIEAVRQVTAHEVYHSLLGTDEHSRLMDMAVDYFGGGMLSVEQMIGAKKAEYEEAGVTLDDHGALDEIGAEFMEIALADERVANRILTEQPNLAQRILGYIRERLADFKAMRGLSEAEKRQYSMLKTAQALYEQGLKAQGRQSASQRRYRIDPNFAQQIKRWVSGQMGANEYFDLGTTPQILQQFGAKPLPIVMAQKVIVKINGGKHNIAWEEIARLPDQIAHPLAILKGSTSNSFVVLTDIADKSGKRVIAAIHLDKMQNRLRVNRVASLYEKDNINNYVAKNINEGKLVYPEKEIASTWFTSEGLQLPKLVQTNVDADLSIAEDTPLSNGLFENLTPEQRAKLLGNGENRRYKIVTAIPKKQQSADLGQRLSLVRSEEPKSRFEQLAEGARYRFDPFNERAKERFAQQVDRVLSGEDMKNTQVFLGRTPSALKYVGFPDLPMFMTAKHLYAVANKNGKYKNVNYHDLGADMVKKLPEAIERPLMILESNTRGDSVVILTDLVDKEGRAVIAAVKFKGTAQYKDVQVEANILTSVYGRNKARDFLQKAIENNKVLYVNKKRSSLLLGNPGLQLPDRILTTNFTNNVARFREKVKSAYGHGVFDNLTPEQRAKLLGDDADQRYSLNRVEGQKSRFEELLEQYGAIPEGETPRTASDARTPQQTDPFNRVSRFTRTAMEAEAVDDDVRQGIRDDLSSDISSGRFVYVPINNKSTLNQANQRLATRGYEQAVNEFRGLYSSGKRLNASDMALGERLIAEASKRGDTETATQLIADVAALGTEMGQAVQALRLIKRMTPEGRLMMLERTVNRINGKLAEEHRPQVELNPRFAEEMLRQETVEGADQVQTDALLDIAEQMPSTLADKINAWRYLSMLGNPRTHIRNIVGNAVFTPVRAVRNILSFTGEQFLPAGVERTKSLLIKPGYRSFAEADYEQAKATISAGGSKYDMFSEIERNKRIFRNPLVEKMRKWNENALEAEDMFFSRRAYVKALAGYMQANHLTPDYLQSGTKQSGADFQRAQNYAVREAQKATFRDYSGMASALNHFERKNAVTKVIGGAVMPFKKTPINILKRGVEYSPMGLAEGLTRGVYQAAKGKITPAELIDRITAGLTGSGIMALGYFLASLGLLSAGEDDPQKKAAYDRAMGSQNYAVDFNTVNRVFNLNLPNGTYTIDWLAPSVMPLMTGVELYNSFNTEYGDDVAPVGQVVTQLTKVINPVLETSMMQGLLGVMQSFQSGSAGQLTDMVGSAASSYGGQFVPTLAGQVARTIDETKRSTYAPTNSPYTQGGERFGRQMMAKLPGASEHLEPQVDIWGREVKQPGGSIAGRAFNNMLNPGLYKPNMETAVDRKLLAMYDKTGESKVLPSGIGKAVEYGGKRYPLKAIEYTAMQKQVGSRRYADVRKLQGSVYTKELDESQMANVIANLYEYRNKEAKAEYLRGKGVAYEDGAYWKAKEAEAAGISPVDYFAVKQIFGGEYEDAKKKYDTCKQLELDFDVYQRVTRELSDIRSDKDRNGRTINGSRKEKVIAYLNQSGLTYEQKRYFLLKAYPSMAK